MISGEHIHYRIGKATLLEDVSLRIEPGELVALCGPNGAGKSTLMRVISGEVRASEGAVSLLGKALHLWRPRELSQTRAKLSQESQLTFSFCVREIVEMGRFPYDSSSMSSKIVDACMNYVGISELRDRDYLSLSGGEKQRVHFARVLAQLSDQNSNQKLLLLDEPTSALDLRHQEVVLSLAAQLCRERGYSVLVILHDLNLAAAWADRVVLLRAGRVIKAGPPNEVLTEEILREAFDVDTTILRHPFAGHPVITLRHTDRLPHPPLDECDER